MKKIQLIAVLFVILFSIECIAASGGVPANAPKVEQKVQEIAPQKVVRPPAPKKQGPTEEELKKAKLEAERKKAKVLVKRKKASLNNTEWDVEIVPIKGGEKAPDLLMFVDGKISLRTLIEQGFSASNFTLTVKDNGNLIWETMQTAVDGTVAFLRGEVTSDVKSMKGIISYPKGNTTEDFSFRSVDKRIASR